VSARFSIPGSDAARDEILRGGRSAAAAVPGRRRHLSPADPRVNDRLIEGLDQPGPATRVWAAYALSREPSAARRDPHAARRRSERSVERSAGCRRPSPTPYDGTSPRSIPRSPRRCGPARRARGASFG